MTLFLYAMQLSDGQDLGRARRFNTLHAYHRALLVLMLVCGVMLGTAIISGQAAAWPVAQKIAAGVVVLMLVGFDLASGSAASLLLRPRGLADRRADSR